MAKIIEFPLADERERLRIEDKIREGMEELNTPEEVIKQVLDWHKEFWAEYKKRLNCQATQPDADSCNEAIVECFERVQDHFQKFTGEMILQIMGLKAALETYKHYHRSPPQ
jgi:hypothetical protein